MSVITVTNAPVCFQGWRIGSTAEVNSVYGRPLKQGDSFILDFGRHLAGYAQLSLRAFDIQVDAPVRLQLVFGKVLTEVAEPFEPRKADGCEHQSEFRGAILAVVFRRALRYRSQHESLISIPSQRASARVAVG